MRKQRFLILFLTASLWGTGTAFSKVTTEEPVIEAMNEAIQDEYRAKVTYQKVIRDFGEIRPFINIVQAEARHIQKLSALYKKRGLETPESAWNEEKVPSYESVGSACRAAVQGELKNIAMYDRLLKLDLPQDVEQTFEYLKAASLENHLPAFRRCSDRS